MSNGRLEPWDFGHPGWVNERFSAHITAPVKDQLTAEVVAWTPGTNGTLTAQAYHMILPERPTPAELTAFLDGVKDKVKGRIVLAGKSVLVPVDLIVRLVLTVNPTIRTTGNTGGGAVVIEPPKSWMGQT